MNTPYYCFGAEGNAEFHRAVADAEEEHLQPFFTDAGWQYDQAHFEAVSALKQDTGATNLFGMASVFAIFVGTCFAKKIFDELYDRTLKRPISKFLDARLSRPGIRAGKVIEMRDVIHLADIETVVVIRALVDKSTAEQMQTLLPQAYRVAHDYIERNGRKAAIHCHKIQGGRVDTQPELFDSLGQMQHADRMRQTAAIGKKV